jgi:hypothetical protein
VGEGRMTLESSQPASKIGIKLEFIKPFAATNATSFVFAAVPGGTKVTWSMDGANNFISKAMSLVNSMDSMIGPDFERGLAALGTVAQAQAEAEAAAKAKAEADARAKAEAEAKAKAEEAAKAEAEAKAKKGKKK